MNPKDARENPTDSRKKEDDAAPAPGGPKDLSEANENIRKAEGDEPVGPDPRKAGNKPALDRGR